MSRLNETPGGSIAAPLMSVPEAQAPPGGSAQWIRGAGGLRLRAAFWSPSRLVPEAPRGTAIISPGRTEPIEKYYELIGNLLARGWCVLAHDWRGQGLSARLLPERLKGHARAPEEFLDDYGRLLDHFEDTAPKPWVMVAHSMGAALNLMTLEAGEQRIAAALLSSPMLKVKTGKRSMWTVKFVVRWNIRNGHAGEYVLGDPDDPFEQNFEEDALTHDRRRYDIWRQQILACPPLALGGPTWGWLNFALEIGERVLKPRALKSVRIPVVVVEAGDDRIVWKHAGKWAADRLMLGRYVEVAEAKHEIIMETDDLRGVFLDEFDSLANTIQAPSAAS